MKNFAETVRNSADIVRVVSDYVGLKGAGNAFKGLCPFHSEKTPSFSVHREKQIFHCFGCGVGGDIFSFVMMAEKVSFPESVRIVAEKCGIPLPLNVGFDDKKSDEHHEHAHEHEAKPKPKATIKEQPKKDAIKDQAQKPLPGKDKLRGKFMSGIRNMFNRGSSSSGK